MIRVQTKPGGEKGTGKRGEVYTTTTLSRLISSLPKAKSGPTEIVIWDIHHLQVATPCLEGARIALSLLHSRKTSGGPAISLSDLECRSGFISRTA